MVAINCETVSELSAIGKDTTNVVYDLGKLAGGSNKYPIGDTSYRTSGNNFLIVPRRGFIKKNPR